MNGLVAVVEVTVVCVLHYFLSFLLRNIFPERAAYSEGAMIVSLFFTVDTLPCSVPGSRVILTGIFIP